MNDRKTISELKHAVKSFCEARDWNQFHSPKELAIGISSEAGELLQIFRFKSEEQIKEIMSSMKREEVCEEISDILFFILRFAQMNSIDLSRELENKLAKNAKKYPVDKARGNNKRYDEF